MPDPKDWEQQPLWKYKLTPHHGTVSVCHSAPRQEQIARTMREPPAESVLSALEAYQQAFFPAMREDELPWKNHIDLTRKTEDKRREWAKQTWTLAWYWRAMYHQTRTWTKRDKKKWFVKICQVRDWALAYFYRVSGGRKVLLRPPIFGRSNRLLRPDSYYVLLSFQREIERAWEEAAAVREKWKHEERAFVLGRTDFVYRLDSIEPQAGGSQLFTIRAHLDLYPFKVGRGDKRLPKAFGLKTSDVPNTVCYPYETIWVPTFRRAEKPSREKPFLLASLPVCRAFEKLSEVWNDRTTRTVLVVAPPGSGKELLAESIYDLRRFEGNYSVYALSPSDNTANAAMLYGRNLKKRQVAQELRRMASGKGGPKSKIVQDFQDGLVFKTRRGLLFLDEIDKVSDDTRAALLRLLETGHCAVHGTPVVVPLEDSSPLYVFAGSMGRDAMFRLKPPDFWTRISHVIEMEHPLDVESPEDRERIARSFFHMFWIRHVFESCGQIGIVRLIRRGKVRRPTETAVRKEAVELFRFLLDKSVLEYFAECFAAELCVGREKVEFSIRNIRNTVARTVYTVTDCLLVDRSYNSPFVKLRSAILKNPTKNQHLFEALRDATTSDSIDRTCGEPQLASDLRAELRRIVQTSIAKVLP